ncbi:stage II sporulation protein P [Aeribacillus sp. FSL M8-0254]|uniref:stage II sporulation protein P n=1 Tax=Aeribacillus sp. FSL M8-0254 TaxID=2954577 RepID=UPI0030F8B99C
MKHRRMVVTVDRTSLKKIILAGFFLIIFMFFITGLLTSIKIEYRPASSSIHEITGNINGRMFLHLLNFENRYFSQGLEESKPDFSVSSVLFQLTTSINPDDPRSLLGRELPGFTLFDGDIIVAGEGTNYTNMPIESAPPTEVLLEEREASIDKLEDVEGEEKPKQSPNLTTNGKKVVFIYHTHTTESYYPLLNGAKSPFHSKANVTLVGEKFGQELEERGIGAVVDKTNFQTVLNEKKWKYYKSYDVSRPVVQEALASNRDLQYIFDIHRDSQKRDKTTITINGKSYAKIAFVIGGNNPNADKNKKIAQNLHKLFEKKYPGLSRGVFSKKGEGVNGVYNQDLSENSLLIEFGGVDNNMEELSRTVEAVANIFSEYYWQAEKVSGSVQNE